MRDHRLYSYRNIGYRIIGKNISLRVVSKLDSQRLEEKELHSNPIRQTVKVAVST